MKQLDGIITKKKKKKQRAYGMQVAYVHLWTKASI